MATNLYIAKFEVTKQLNYKYKMYLNFKFGTLQIKNLQINNKLS